MYFSFMPGMKVTLSALVDGKNINAGGHKLGLGLELEAWGGNGPLQSTAGITADSDLNIITVSEEMKQSSENPLSSSYGHNS